MIPNTDKLYKIKASETEKEGLNIIVKKKYMKTSIRPVWSSAKSNLLCGRGTIPGSENTVRRWEKVRSKIMELNATAWKAPHKLQIKSWC